VFFAPWFFLFRAPLS